MNVEAFKELIDIYSDFTVEELAEFWIENGGYTMRELTGFSTSGCRLCKAANKKCCNCLYSINKKQSEHVPCIEGTYDLIEYAKTPEELYDALQKRIEFMKEVLKSYEK
jgi:LPS O-antigen subunit length determinant protein (WzzB/FepE family)